MRPIGIDLFSGAGGLSLGFEQAGFDVVAAVEFDPVHCAVHEFNFPNCTVVCRDIGKVSGAEIRQATNIGRRDIDVVVGGAPCQGFSLIGKRALDDPRNRLVREFARVVFELKPKHFVFENVKGLTVGPHRRVLEEFVEEFSNFGYDITLPYAVLNAAHFGVPQDRQRLFLLGSRKGLNLVNYPSLRTRPVAAKAAGDLAGLPVGPTVQDAIGDLPSVERYPELLHRDWVAAQFGKPSAYVMHLRRLTVGDHDFSYRRKWNPTMLTSSLRTEHTKKSRARFRATKPGETEPISRFLKLDARGICNTLRAGTGSDRGAYTSPRPIHPRSPRCITVREAARLHSYPDWFRFHVTKWHGFRQIGNSVPPLLGRAVAAEVMRALGAKPERSSRTLSLGDDRLLSFNMGEAAAYYEVQPDVVGKRRRMAVNE